MAIPIVQRQRDPDVLDKLATIANVVQTVYGISAKSKELDLSRQKLQQDAAAKEQDSADKFQKENVFTAKEIASGGYDVSDTAKPGFNPAFILPQQTEQGVESTPIQAYIKKPVSLFQDPFGMKGLQKEKITQDIEKGRKEAATLSKGKQLQPDKVLLLQEGAQIPNQLVDIASTIEKNKDIFGPVEGRIRGLNPYDERANTIDAQMRASSQAFGRYMEGGVLRKEDEEKYRKMFPSLADIPALAENKLSIVSDLLVKKHNENVNVLKKQGWDITGFEQIQSSGLPSVLGGKPKTVIQNGQKYILNEKTGEYE